MATQKKFAEENTRFSLFLTACSISEHFERSASHVWSYLLEIGWLQIEDNLLKVGCKLIKR